MKSDEVKVAIEESLAQLKDFQKATVDHIFQKFYVDGHDKHLVADEVGLGKTIVAKGLIARALEHQFSSGRKKPFRVVYICSNQALTRQNLSKLNIFNDNDFLEEDKGRLIFQAFKSKTKSKFQLSSLTPSTSFRLIKGSGIAEERKLIWLLLSQHETYTKYRHGLKLCLLGYIEYPDWWVENLDKYESKKQDLLRGGLRKKFVRKVEKEKVDLNTDYYAIIKEELKLEENKVSLQDMLLRYAKILRVDTIKKKEGPKKLLGILRKLLTDITLDYLEADLFILDEFQRFKDLIDTSVANEDLSEAAAIAQKIFSTKNAKVLMLSATPFKPYTTSADEADQETHFGEFQTVLSFLLEHDKLKLDRFKDSRKEYFELLRRPSSLNGGIPTAKIELENIYRPIMSRTERILVAENKNTLVRNITDKSLDLYIEDVKQFISIDAIMQGLDTISHRKIGSVLEYVKSSPYPLSFLESYVAKEELRKYIKEKTIKKLIQSNENAWLDLDKIQHYKSLGEIPNARMRLLMEEALKNGLWKQLWLSPSLTYYSPEGAYKDSDNNSKVLVFSKWKMVPRAIASLITYEVERRSIGDKRILPDEDRVYTQKFMAGNKKRAPRKPGKILSLKLKEGKPSSMSVFSLVYPSLTLVNLHNIKENLNRSLPLSRNELLEEIKERVKARIEEANVSQYCTGEGTSRNWYWVAPLLMDKFFYTDIYKNWFLKKKYNDTLFLKNRGFSDNDDEKEGREKISKGAERHIQELIEVFNHPEEYQLGQFPADLYEVLALMVIASPGTCILRSISSYFNDDAVAHRINSALDIATEFHALFDKPDSIAVIQLNHLENHIVENASSEIYWRHVLDYCADGNFQAMLDEFSHLIYPDNRTLHDFRERVVGSINITTSSINVDNAESFLKNQPVKMRCHYAVDFGNQDLERKEGLDRVQSVLQNFNSPFRPFVLASTSIGQEGLDFHYYCRKVMHWNLPSNPIDLEQREGRVNRFKGLVIRQNLVKKYAKHLRIFEGDLWQHLFEIAMEMEGKQTEKYDLVPFWHLEADDIFIERLIPVLPYSREIQQVKDLLTTLTLYRLTFGQPRQEELVESLYNNLDEDSREKVIQDLIINLSPASYA